MSAVPHLRAVERDHRREALDRFAELAELPAIKTLVQRGKEPDSATFTFFFEDGRKVRVGTIKTLWSQTELSRVLSVTIGRPLPPFEAKTWYGARTRLLCHGVTIDDAPGESFAETVRDWLEPYAANAGTDSNGALATGRQFVEGGELWIKPAQFAQYIRRYYGTSVKDGDLKLALGDLGFESKKRHYTRTGNRSTTTFYHAAVSVVESEPLTEP